MEQNNVLLINIYFWLHNNSVLHIDNINTQCFSLTKVKLIYFGVKIIIECFNEERNLKLSVANNRELLLVAVEVGGNREIINNCFVETKLISHSKIDLRINLPVVNKVTQNLWLPTILRNIINPSYMYNYPSQRKHNFCIFVFEHNLPLKLEK